MAWANFRTFSATAALSRIQAAGTCPAAPIPPIPVGRGQGGEALEIRLLDEGAGVELIQTPGTPSQVVDFTVQ
jgi:hypothetical protein